LLLAVFITSDESIWHRIQDITTFTVYVTLRIHSFLKR